MSVVVPSLSYNYPLSTLPRTSDLKLHEKVVIPAISSAEPDSIDVGISKSIISSYIIRPTPKLIWSYALSPVTIVDCMAVCEKENNKLYIVGVTERRKHKLLLLNRSLTGSAEDSTTETMELKLEERLKDVKIFNDGALIVAVYESGSIDMFKTEANSLVSTVVEPITKKSKNAPKLLHSQFIDDLSITDRKNFVVLAFHDKTHLHFKLVALNIASSSFFEVNSAKIEVADPASSKIAYAAGFLYHLSPAAKEITSYTIPTFNSQRTISVRALFPDTFQAEEVSFFSPSIDRVLLSVANKIHLINFKFSCLLDTFESRSSSSSVANPDKVLINQVVKVKGSGRDTKSLAVYLYLKNKDNNVYLNVINIDVGLNILSECLGKSIDKNSNEDFFKGLVDLAKQDFETESESLSQELGEVFHHLQEAKRTRDFNKWERILIPYLKNEDWDVIKKSLKSKKKTSEKVYKFKEFEVESDRAVDVNFVTKVLSLIFKINTSKVVEFADPEFIPEHTLIYLLTNPIFPVEYTRGLLKLFSRSEQVTLLRQAIITCPNLTIHELLLQLFSSHNDEVIFSDLINRLIGVFATVDINKEFKKLLQNEESSVNLNDLLNRLLQVKNNHKSWNLIEITIDAGGLFNWSLDTIEKLNELIETKVHALMENSYNLTLTNQVLLFNEPASKKKSKKKSKPTGKSVTDDIVSNNVQQHSQLESIISVKNGAKNKRLDDPSIEISKKYPNYTVDRLLL
ncbi:hypothetical protein G9P44_000996 [Scheffersomyces stipitis]|nr:hypothetical protein G9P44_000996 [Scheffersomyces stipitis]